jgi:hypothetical protein
LAKSTGGGKQSAEERLNFLQSKEQAAIASGNTKEAERYKKAIEAVTLAIERQNYELKASLDNITELSDSVKSLGAFVGKNNKLFETMNSLTDGMSVSLDSVSQQMTKLGPEAKKFKKETYKTADAYKNMGNVIAINVKKLKKQQTTTSQYNQSVLDSYDELEEAIDRLESQMDGLTGTSLEAAQAIKRTLDGQRATLQSFAAAAEKSDKVMKATNFTFQQLSSSGIPAANEMGEIVKTMQEGGKGLTLAFAALGATLGKLAYDLGFIGDKIGTIAKYDQQIGDLTTKIDIFNDKLRLGMVGPGGKNFVAAKAINDFSNQVANMAMEFQAASKTALFGKGLGGVGYGAAQLQMAGISAETIATAMQDVASVMGSNVSGKFGADIAILAARTGQTSQNIASINDTFMRLDGVSKETAISMQEGMRAMAAQANVNLGALMEDVAEASKDALSYQIKSGPALAKAAAFANSIGTKFTDIANAGKSMVLNYKDSIKAEMSLSAMLGRRVDLSQVRALFASGDQEGALRALKAQGLDPSKMNMFQQEQLKNATGGMDLNTLQKIATRTGKTGNLGKGNVGAENQVFLSAKSSAESAKAVGAAVQAAMTEIQNKELENEYNRAKNQALIDNTDGIADLTKQLKQKETEKSIMSSGAGYALGGAALFALLTKGKGLGKLFSKGGMSNIFGKGAGASPATAAANGSKFGGYKMVGKNMVHDASGKFVSRANADAFKQSQGWVKAKSGVLYKPGTPQANAINAASKGGLTPASKLATTAATTGTTGMTSSLANTAKAGLGSKVTSNLLSSVKGLGGVVSVLSAGYDYKTRKDQGQTTLQAASGAGGGAAGALAGAALGSAIVPVIGTIIGGAIGYWAGSSLADELTGANEPTVEAQEEAAGTYEMTNAELEAEIANGNLLNSSEYAVELQQKMLEIMGLQAEFLNDIAESNRSVTSVNLDGSKVLSLLNGRSAKNYGVTRLTSINRNVK